MLPRAQQDEPRPGDARRIQPLRAWGEPLADARSPAGDIVQEKRHIRPDAGGQPDKLRQGQGFRRAGVQPSEQRRRVRAPSPAPCGMPFSSTASTPGWKPEASANRR